MEVRGPATFDTLAKWLDDVRIPVRLGVMSRTGPRVVSLWYVRDGGTLWCATQHDAAILRYLAHEPTVGFEVAVDAPPYRGVRGTANATLHPEQGPAMIDTLMDRYLTATNDRLRAWLAARRDTEVAVALSLTCITSWDFSSRMAPEDPDWIIPGDAHV